MLFAQTVMGRLGAAFIKAYPEVQLDVTAEDRFTNLIEDGYDIVVRINPRRDEDLVGRRFLKAGFVLVAATSMQRPARAKSAGLVPLVAAVMRTGEPDDVIWTVMDGKKELRIRPKAVLRFSSPLMMRDAVLAGAGCRAGASLRCRRRSG